MRVFVVCLFLEQAAETALDGVGNALLAMLQDLLSQKV